MRPRLRCRKSGQYQRESHRILLPRGMAQSGRGKFVIDSRALPACIAGISEMQRCRTVGKKEIWQEMNLVSEVTNIVVKKVTFTLLKFHPLLRLADS